MEQEKTSRTHVTALKFTIEEAAVILRGTPRSGDRFRRRDVAQAIRAFIHEREKKDLDTRYASILVTNLYMRKRNLLKTESKGVLALTKAGLDVLKLGEGPTGTSSGASVRQQRDAKPRPRLTQPTDKTPVEFIHDMLPKLLKLAGEKAEAKHEVVQLEERLGAARRRLSICTAEFDELDRQMREETEQALVASRRSG